MTVGVRHEREEGIREKPQTKTKIVAKEEKTKQIILINSIESKIGRQTDDKNKHKEATVIPATEHENKRQETLRKRTPLNRP